MNKIVKRTFSLIGLLIIVFLFSNFYHKYIDKHGAIHPRVELENGWEATFRDVQLDGVALDRVRFPLFQKGDTLILSTILPQSLPKHPVLIIKTVHSDIRAFVDDREIYTYGTELYDAGKMVGYGSQSIELEPDYAGKRLTIVLRVAENNAFSSLETPYIADLAFEQSDFMIANRLRMSIILFLIVFGIVILITVILGFRASIDHQRLACIGMFSTLIGVWSLCTTDIVRYFTYDLIVKNNLEYATLFMAPLFVFAYFWKDIKKESKGRIVIFFIIEGAFALVMSLSFILHALNIVHMPAFLRAIHFLIVLGILFLVYRLISDMSKGIMHSTALVHGFEILSIFVLTDLGTYNLKKYTKLSIDDHYSSIIYIGVLIFVVTLIIDFCGRLYRDIYEKIERDTLKRMAYTDELTGLFNRRKFEESLTELETEQKACIIVGFDLNNLKKINDSLGHGLGDSYIHTFGDTLRGIFEGLGIICRVGGDEFDVIVTDADVLETGVEAYIDKLNDAIENVNRRNPGWNMSTAYGICKWDMKNTTIHEAVRIADERMYDNKAKMKTGKVL